MAEVLQNFYGDETTSTLVYTKRGYHKGSLCASPCSYFGTQISRLVKSPVRHFFTRFFHIAHEKLSWDISPRHFREIFPAIPSPEYHRLNPHNLLRPIFPREYSLISWIPHSDPFVAENGVNPAVCRIFPTMARTWDTPVDKLKSSESGNIPWNIPILSYISTLHILDP
jgi:hypothetical protein